MSPRNFDKVSKLPMIKHNDRVLQAPNLWFAFTAITGIDRLFSYTAEVINTNPVKDSQSGTQITSD